MTGYRGVISLKISDRPAWGLVNIIHDKCSALLKLKGVPLDIQESVLMCVSELVENAVKYGTDGDDAGKVSFELNTGSSGILIAVSNRIKDKYAFASFVRLIEKIRKADNPAVLYTGRFTELIKKRKPGESRLGLYRIVYEGGFTLDYSLDNDILTVSAGRDYGRDFYCGLLR